MNRAAKADLDHQQTVQTKMLTKVGTSSQQQSKMEDKWTIASGKNGIVQPTLNGGGDWIALGNQLQRMVSIRLQEAEGTFPIRLLCVLFKSL
jgi:hypothetical protein